MKASVVTVEKPVPRLSIPDWHKNSWELQQTSQTRRDDACRLRHDSRQMRNETNIQTHWDTYHNNTRLTERLVEVDRWRETFQSCLDRVDQEIYMLKHEKILTERELDALTLSLGVLNECMTVRDSRLQPEITHDEADLELSRELCVLEDIKKMLTNRCQESWERTNRLNELRFKLNLEVENKKEAVQIEKDQLMLCKNSANISYKLDPLRAHKSSVPYDTWIEHNNYLKMLTDNELTDSIKFREILFVTRERARNDMRTQRDSTDYILRKRIYDTQRARNELQWQQHKMQEEMKKLHNEIEALQVALLPKHDALKLAETRLENRYMRSMVENAKDDPEFGLKNEIVQLRRTIQDINDKLSCVKTTYNALEEQMVIIDRDLANKNHALMIDVQCLDLRIKLRMDNFPEPPTETDRNIKLSQMTDEIPST